MHTAPNSALASRTFDAPRRFPWCDPPAGVTLTHDDVHVWRVALEVHEGVVRQLEDRLAADEQLRADRFQFAQDRRRFVVRRGVLRAVLGWYLGTRPERLRFECNRHGKPSLAGQTGVRPIRFNLAHSADLAVIAVTHGREVGVDVERLDARVDSLEIAERFFSPREAAALRGRSPSAQTRAFFHCWTRKEAYLKARGMGVTWPLDRVEVSVSPGRAALLNVCDDPAELSRWSVQDLNPEPGYVGALVVESFARDPRRPLGSCDTVRPSFSSSPWILAE